MISKICMFPRSITVAIVVERGIPIFAKSITYAQSPKP